MIDRFARRLAEAVQWCEPRVTIDDPAHCLRSPALAPPLDHDDWPAAVESVCERRARLIEHPGPHGRAMPGGRLLVFDPGQSLSDGAASVETGGLFDEDNTPPWDTWVAYIQEHPQHPDAWTTLDSYLLCWIPAALTELVDSAIAVNPERCLLWADVADTPFLRQWRDD